MLKDFHNYWLKLPKGYVRNTENNYYNDMPAKNNEIWQPEVYSLAQHLISREDFDCIVDIECGNGHKLAELRFAGRKIGLDFGHNIEISKTAYPDFEWIETDLNFPIADLDLPPRLCLFVQT